MRDEFLSNILGINVFRLKTLEEIEKIKKGIAILRVEIDKKEVLEKLIKEKFLPVSVDVLLRKKENVSIESKVKIEDNIEKKKIEKFLEKINKLNDLFPTSHFYKSPFIREKADLIYKEWVKNDLNGRSKNYFAIIDNKIAGFISLINNHIDLFFVLPEFRNRGIGKALLGYVCSHYPDLTVMTQLDNPVLYLYLKFGFKIEKFYITLHKLIL